MTLNDGTHELLKFALTTNLATKKLKNNIKSLNKMEKNIIMLVHSKFTNFCCACVS